MALQNGIDSNTEPTLAIDDEKYMTMYLQHVDMMRQLSKISVMLEENKKERLEDRSFASFTYSMVMILIGVASMSVLAIFLFSR